VAWLRQAGAVKGEVFGEDGDVVGGGAAAAADDVDAGGADSCDALCEGIG